MDHQIKKEERILRSSLIKKNSSLGTKEKRPRVILGGGLNVFHKHISEYDKGQRQKIRDKFKGIEDIDLKASKIREALREYKEQNQNNSFVTSEKTICTKVRQPKKGKNEKNRKIENALSRNQNESIMLQRVNEGLEWEQYNKDNLNKTKTFSQYRAYKNKGKKKIQQRRK